jgi:hypothetical protein
MVSIGSPTCGILQIHDFVDLQNAQVEEQLLHMNEDCFHSKKAVEELFRLIPVFRNQKVKEKVHLFQLDNIREQIEIIH